MGLKLYAVDCDPSGNWFGSQGTTLKKSTDNGANWSDIYTIPGTGTGVIFCDSRGYVYISPVSSDSGVTGLYRSTDVGQSFTKVLAMDADTYVWGIDEDASGNLYAGEYSVNNAGQMQIWKSSDGGATWAQKYSNDRGPASQDHIHDLRVAPNGWIYATTGDISPDPFLRSKDAGETWESINDTTIRMLSIAFRGGYVYLGSDVGDDKIYRFLDDGGASVSFTVSFDIPEDSEGWDAIEYGDWLVFLTWSTNGSDATAIYAYDGQTWQSLHSTAVGTKGYRQISSHHNNGVYLIARHAAADAVNAMRLTFP